MRATDSFVDGTAIENSTSGAIPMPQTGLDDYTSALVATRVVTAFVAASWRWRRRT